MAEFTKDRYGVDVMKVEMPINMKFVEGTQAFAGQKAYTKQEALDHFRRTAEVATKPFIYLSAGVSNAEFTESLDLAAEAGTRYSGVLCGRATWKDGIPVYGKQGGQAFKRVARERGRQEHRERQRPPRAGASVVRVLRGEVGGRVGITSNPKLQIPNPNHSQIPNFQDQLPTPNFEPGDWELGWEWLGFGIWSLGFDISGCSVSTPLTFPRQVSPEYGTRIDGDADLGGALQGDVAAGRSLARWPRPERVQSIVEPLSVPWAVPVSFRSLAQVALNEPRAEVPVCSLTFHLKSAQVLGVGIRLDEVQLPSRLPEPAAVGRSRYCRVRSRSRPRSSGDSQRRKPAVQVSSCRVSIRYRAQAALATIAGESGV